MIYRGPGFFAVVWFGSSPIPSPLPPLPSVSSTGGFERKATCWRERREGGVGRGAESYNAREPSINHSILSGLDVPGVLKTSLMGLHCQLHVPPTLNNKQCGKSRSLVFFVYSSVSFIGKRYNLPRFNSGKFYKIVNVPTMKSNRKSNQIPC